MPFTLRCDLDLLTFSFQHRRWLWFIILWCWQLLSSSVQVLLTKGNRKHVSTVNWPLKWDCLRLPLPAFRSYISISNERQSFTDWNIPANKMTWRDLKHLFSRSSLTESSFSVISALVSVFTSVPMTSRISASDGVLSGSFFLIKSLSFVLVASPSLSCTLCTSSSPVSWLMLSEEVASFKLSGSGSASWVDFKLKRDEGTSEGLV